jgi:4-hydroxymandelate oxidase
MFIRRNMDLTSRVSDSRRKFLRYLALSPVLASPALLKSHGWNFLGSDTRGGEMLAAETPGPAAELITSAEQALDVMEFEAVARKVLPPAHFAYLATGVDDDATVGINHEAYSHLEIRERRLVNVEELDTSVQLFGTKWKTPIFLCPVSALKAFHPEGEVAAAKAARSKHNLQILSTVASTSVEEVTAARGEPVWQQLYPTNDWNVTRAIIKRAEAAGCPVLVFTIDLQENSNREMLARGRRVDNRECSVCHEKGFAGYLRQSPMFDGLDVTRVSGLYDSSLTWDFVKRLKDTTKMKLIVKGVVTHEDAQLAVEHGADGIVVSNHGGRAEESLRSTIECLPEVVYAVKGKIPVLIDGGIRRGTDVFKALALGATAVGIGRPYAWGLAAFGQPGVEAVLAIMRRELETTMRQAGTPSVAAITKSFVTPRT